MFFSSRSKRTYKKACVCQYVLSRSPILQEGMRPGLGRRRRWLYLSSLWVVISDQVTGWRINQMAVCGYLEIRGTSGGSVDKARVGRVALQGCASQCARSRSLLCRKTTVLCQEQQLTKRPLWYLVTSVLLVGIAVSASPRTRDRLKEARNHSHLPLVLAEVK